MNDADTVRRGVMRITPAHPLAVYQYLAVVRLNFATKYIDERALTRSILAHERVDLPGLDIQRDAAQSLVGTKTLRYRAQSNRWLSVYHGDFGFNRQSDYSFFPLAATT
jgi:hypothetical protein